MTAQKPQGQPTKRQEAVARAICEYSCPYREDVCAKGCAKTVHFRIVDKMGQAQAAIRATLDEIMEPDEAAQSEGYGAFLLAKEGVGFAKAVELYWLARLCHIKKRECGE